MHFDAHLDTWDTYFDAPLHARHAVPARGGGGPASSRAARAHVGIRGSLYDRADLLDDAELGFTIVHCRGHRAASASTASSSGSCERVGDHPVYVSIDIDVLDPAYAPGTGTPEAGGTDQPRAARRCCAD